MIQKLFLLLAITLPLAIQAQNIDIHQLANRIDEHYNSLTSMQTEFTESFAGAGMTRQESGIMSIRKPGKMRWDYTSPIKKVFVTDGKVAWFYVPGEKQARRVPVKKLDDLRSPLRYLLGRTKLEKEFVGLSYAPDKKPMTSGDVMLRGIPKGMEDRVNQVLLEITSDAKIARIQVESLDGSMTEFQFRNQKDNVAMSLSHFSFSPPPGVEVMEATELEP